MHWKQLHARWPEVGAPWAVRAVLMLTEAARGLPEIPSCVQRPKSVWSCSSVNIHVQRYCPLPSWGHITRIHCLSYSLPQLGNRTFKKFPVFTSWKRLQIRNRYKNPADKTLTLSVPFLLKAPSCPEPVAACKQTVLRRTGLRADI